jgi:hypothetical protein
MNDAHPEYAASLAPVPRRWWLIPFVAGLLLGIATALAAGRWV